MSFLGSISKAATGGAWSTDGDGLAQGGSGLWFNDKGGGGISSALDFVPGIGDARAQDKANLINIQQAEVNRRFQERMSNTAYQRAMADMKQAGLNPILAYMQGGASTPSGTQATVQSSSKTALGDMALKATTGIGGLQQSAKQTEIASNVGQSTVQLNAANAAKSVAEAERAKADTGRIKEETRGLGRKASEGNLWNRFYKGINSILDNSAKSYQDHENALKNLREKQDKQFGKERSRLLDVNFRLP
nr:MAG: DNA pilot protein [Microvirus sp.]